MWIKIKDRLINSEAMQEISIAENVILIAMFSNSSDYTRVIKLEREDFMPEEWEKIYKFFSTKFPVHFDVFSADKEAQSHNL